MRSLEKRFWTKVVCDIATHCWLWTGGRDQDGYGTITRGRHSEGSMRATHASLQIYGTPVPKGQWALHDCPAGDDPSCVNPDHLFIGNADANSKDMWSKGRARPKGGGAKGEHQHAARLTESIVREMRVLNAAGSTTVALAQRYNVSQATVWNAVRRHTWKHVE